LLRSICQIGFENAGVGIPTRGSPCHSVNTAGVTRDSKRACLHPCWRNWACRVEVRWWI